MQSGSPQLSAEQLADRLVEFIDEYVRAHGGDTRAKKPGHRIPFHWPPPPISFKYHVLKSDWSGSASIIMHGESFDLDVATTPHGVFVRCEKIWHEAKGKNLKEATESLIETSTPYFARQIAIASALGREGRYQGRIEDLPAEDLVKLLYCEDRDIANSARLEIELHGSDHIFLPAMITILRDQKHPMRRSAQWCVLDLFEDIHSFCNTDAEQAMAVQAIRDLIYHAEDDFARTIYKAGVVIGGHLPADIGGDILLDCLQSPSRVARRSAVHGLFHVVEWDPDSREKVVSAINRMAENEPEPSLKVYALAMAKDIASGAYDHITEPIFEDE